MRKNKITIWDTINKIGLIITIVAGIVGILWFCWWRYEVVTNKEEILVENTIKNMIILPVDGNDGISQFINKKDYETYLLVIVADSAYKRNNFFEAETLYYNSYRHFKDKGNDYLANLFYYGVARSKIGNNNYTEALEILREINTVNCDSIFAREVYSKYISTLCNHAITLYDHKKALTSFKKVLTIPPYYECDYFNRGFAFSRLKQFDSAIINYDRAIKLDSSLYDVFNNRGNAYLFERNYLKAIEDFTSLLTIEPKNVEAYTKRGVCYYLTKDNNRAISDFTSAYNIDSTDLIAIDNLRRIYSDLGNKQQAMFWASKLLKIQGH